MMGMRRNEGYDAFLTAELVITALSTLWGGSKPNGVNLLEVENMRS